MRSLVVQLVVTLLTITAISLGSNTASALTIVSWNVDNYAAPGAQLRGRARAADEHLAMRVKLADQQADIIALQEISSLPAALALVGEQYEVAIESRCLANASRCSRPSGRIYTAIAWKRTLNDRITPFDLPELSIMHVDDCGVSRPVRGGVGVEITPSDTARASAPMKVLSVHLKAACKDDKIEDGTADDCATQAAQFAILRDWITAQRTLGIRTIIAGDFNRRLLDRRDSQRAALTERFGDDLALLPQGERACWRDARGDFEAMRQAARQKHAEFDENGISPWIYHPKHTAVVDHFLLNGFGPHSQVRTQAQAQQVSMAGLYRFGGISDFIIRNCDGSPRANLAFVETAPSDHCPLRLTIPLR